MPENRFKSYDYEDIKEAFTEKKIKDRYVSLYKYLAEFIARSNYDKSVIIVEASLNQAVVDYFTDILRLKRFHKIENVNFIKIHAYSAYWLLRRRPLQVIDAKTEDSELSFVNEDFIATYLVSFLNGQHSDLRLLENDRAEYYEFISNLKYFLRYRLVSPQMLETILMAYKAGCSFQHSFDCSDI